MGEGLATWRKVLLHEVYLDSTTINYLTHQWYRNQGALVAFALPQKWKQGAGLSIVATHVDSPNLKVSVKKANLLSPLNQSTQIRPISKRTKQGYLQVGVETYGGGIWHSWLDRDLSIAGRVVISDKNGSFNSKLIKIDQPILRIPTLAIHRTIIVHASWNTLLTYSGQWTGVSTTTSSSIRRPSLFRSLG